MLRKAGFLTLAFMVVAAAEAQATFRIENHLNPAGDPTRIKYRMEGATWPIPPFEFELVDGDYLSAGPPPGGGYTASALLPPGWVVQDIQCVGPLGPSDFAIDVPNGRVTLLRHGATDEHICAFTNRKLGQAGGSSTGVAPSPLPGEVQKVVLPRRPQLIGVAGGRGLAKATIRVTRRSVFKGTLKRGKRVVGTRRIVLKPGTYDVSVPLDRKRMRRMRNRGLEQVTLTLRIAVTARRGGATHAFTHRVVVKL